MYMGTLVDEETKEESQEKENLGWRGALPKDLQNHEAFQNKEVKDVAQEYLSLKEKIEKSIPVITENSDEKEIKEFKEKLGIPDSADDYKLPDVELPEGMEKDEDFESRFKNEAIEANLTKAQFEKLFKFANEYMGSKYTETINERKKNHEDAEKTLKKDWGNSYGNNLKKAQNIIKKYADDEEIKEINKTGIGNNPVFIKLFHKIAQDVSEDKFVQGESSGTEEKPTRSVFSYPNSNMDKLKRR